jgi:phenylalanyl-tRNA synthetase beta chain
MKFTLAWLKSHLATRADLKAITDRLLMLGLEVESVADRGAGLEPFVSAAVLSAMRHPNADKLTVCRIDAGQGPVQVVCGAPNARRGMIGVYAPVGAVIPGTGLTLKTAVIRGEISQGMLVSERELGLSEEHASIIELPPDTPIGARYAALAGLDDPVIELKLTPNRGDCLAVRGIARDLAASGLGRLKPLSMPAIKGAFASPIGIGLDAVGDACPLFLGRYLRGVKNQPSPPWLSRRLTAIGLRPISALVDVTNFIACDLGRPLHVFDADTIAGDLKVRLSCQGDKLRALDGREYELGEGVTVICDDRGVLSLGGVMGGEASSCTLATRSVLLESALFDPRRTAETGRKLGIQSEARQRFERGVDPALVRPGLEIASRMILDLCGGEASRITTAGREPTRAKKVSFRPERVRELGGVEFAKARCRRHLRALGFTVKPGKKALTVAVPSWRHDIENEADLVEEVLRIEGYDAIPAVPLPRVRWVAKPALTREQRLGPLARRALAGRGLVEIITYSFVAHDRAVLFGGGDPSLKLVNPISADADTMRPSLLPGLTGAARRNIARGFADLALFEVGPQYASDRADGQMRVAAALRSGLSGPRHWAERLRPVDLFDVKADALAVLAAIGVSPERLQVGAGAPPWYHPGRSGTLQWGEKGTLAQFGALHPELLAKLELPEPVVACEIFLDRAPMPSGGRPALEVSDLPAVHRDFAFVVDRALPADAIVEAAKAADRALIRDVQVFDLFTGESVGPDVKSIAISVRIEPQEKTLTEPEIEAIAAKIVAAVTKATGGQLRG